MSIAPRSAPLNPPLSTPPEPQPARPHIAERQEARRRQILDTAAQLFYSKGYPGMTMNDLCRALGVTKPAVYYYFTDKYEIFDILCRESAQTCLPVIRETADPALPVRERLQACLLEMARRCVACHVPATLSFRDNQYLRPDTVAWLDSMARDFYRDLYALLEEGKRDGVFAFGDARVTAHAIGSVVGFLYTWHEPGRMDPETLAQELAASMMKLALPSGG
ncbi:DNA-binding protein, AcrR family, includes nucleoid occlusion protein SlmA [Cupriavidus necator]|jgi:AcrR family transcriptional regulator|uniref:TetR/AcrR family transcriptional regulator n=1 Tax=Cupriavidus necator (strain ATCC 17699 / DSM 428 / KCTC 22496 / NCIMB 10442 / H16 / Stanier 337) TaxID=381666 RepID=Q0K6K8_CUPNH|nr:MULTISPECIES: TetR/AcrR family transcriptional regulator [Cupriavidus]EON16094.1 TetR/AcrR family transcriptional regulator [Cupriavidus sp. GA3-3]KUE85883.1 TetR family transcriptional regulator [Cupriavidus necator]QCC02118.1 TetR/AcrR family transcriptional regulator [Cupriavidus necator H16]QQB78475.1 TetR/AcrR family transcriptional regulator [Cupriavidus necator]WKA40523.1 TetR/AcrR family transcriptional regulator [Cupriavidus necator]